MSQPPEHYLYLVAIETDEVLAIHPLDGLHPLKAITAEAQLRATANVDDPESGLAIRDSDVRPLPADDLARIWRLVRGR